MVTLSHITVTEGYVTEPVDLDAVKAWLKIDYDDEDDALLAMITGARETIEGYTNIHLVPKTVVVEAQVDFEDSIQHYHMTQLPYTVGKPTVITVKELADDFSETVLTDGTGFYLRGNMLYLPNGNYNVTYTSVPGMIPEAVKEAIMMEVAKRFEKRGEEGDSGISEGAKEKAKPYMQVWL